MDARMMKKFVRLDKLRRELDKKVKENEKEIAELGPRVLDSMMKDGTQKMTVDGLTCYIERTLWVKTPVDDPTKPKEEQISLKDEAIAVLESNPNTADYVRPNFNAQSVSVYLREAEDRLEVGQTLQSCNRLAELEKDGFVLPEELQPLKNAIGASEVFKIKTRLA